MSKSLHVAILGATGAVGEEFLAVLEQRKFPVASLKLLASERSAGQGRRFAGENLRVEAVRDGAFRGVDLALFSAGASTSRAWAAKAIEQGCLVVDNSSAFRMDPSTPLVVPECNLDAARSHQGIIANPNCSTIILCVALAPLVGHGLRRVVVSTYQAASGAGARAMQELYDVARGMLRGEAPRAEVFAHPLAFNLLPQVDAFLDGGYTKEEDKMLLESRKILGQPELVVEATCVRVPVGRCHSESVAVELQRPLLPAAARALFERAPGLLVVDRPSERAYPMPLDFSGRDEVGIGRIRQSRVFAGGLAFWIVGDQLRKGAALNAVQIAESLLLGKTNR